MTGLATPVLDPAAVVGSGQFVASVAQMELGALSSGTWSVAPQMYEVPGPMFDPAFGATKATIQVPLVFQGRLASNEYFERFVLEAARAQAGIAELLATQLEHEAGHLSAVRRAARLYPFERLMSLGPAAISVALRRLNGGHRPLWLFFLQRVTGERPALGATEAEDASLLWRRWGQEHGFNA